MTKNRFNPSPSGHPESLESGGTRAVEPPRRETKAQTPKAKDEKAST